MNNPNPKVYSLEEKREIDGAGDPLILEIFGELSSIGKICLVTPETTGKRCCCT